MKIWIISEGTTEGVWTITLLTAAYLLFTLLQVRSQFIAMTTSKGIAGQRAYVTFIKKQRSKEGFTRLLAVGLAVGSISALPELVLAFQPSTSWMEGSVFFAVFITDAVRLYMTC